MDIQVKNKNKSNFVIVFFEINAHIIRKYNHTCNVYLWNFSKGNQFAKFGRKYI